MINIIIGILIGWAAYQTILVLIEEFTNLDILNTDGIWNWILFPVPMILFKCIINPVAYLYWFLFMGRRFTWNYNEGGKFWRWFTKEEYAKVIASREQSKADFLAKVEKDKAGKFIVYKEYNFDQKVLKDFSEPLSFKAAKKHFYKRAKAEKFKIYFNEITRLGASRTKSDYYILMVPEYEFNDDFPDKTIKG